MIKQSKKQASVAAILKRGHTNSNDEHPVKIRVTFNRVQKFYPVSVDGKPLYMDSTAWEKMWSKDALKALKNLKDRIESVKALAIAARDKISHGRVFTFDRFEREFLNQESKKGILYLYEKYLQQLLEDDRIGSYESYKSAYHSFNKFRGGRTQSKEAPFARGKEILPEDLTTDILKKYDAWLKEGGCNKTSIGIYMRALRIIYNNAVDINPSLAEFYPFSKKQNDNKRYKIRSGSGKKGQAMTMEDLQKFINTSPIEGTPEWEAKQYWLFMFYASGMNMADVAALRHENIKIRENLIRYVRRKTKDTERNEEVIEIPLSLTLQNILVAIGNPDKSQAYVFPILSKDMNPRKMKAVTKQKTKIINKWLSRLCKENDLPEITTYWSRHTSATLLRDSGVSVEMISELLGHSDVKVTKEYLKGFSIKKKSDAIEAAMKILKVS